MKKFSSVISLSFIVLFLLVFSLPSICFSEPDSKVWEIFDLNWYYNKTNITKSSNITSVWTYRIVTDDDRKEQIDIIKEDDLEKSIKYKNWDHYLTLTEIDCKNKLKRRKESIDYDYQGNVLNHNIKNHSDWNNIIPDSSFDELYKRICVTKKKPSKKK